ncbi:hypothetical protein DM02DRAFT_689964 [Periconia macrospinosa]|uniref:DUF8021 domain-containing protein n=1 Tax=Periconia macrospinosa TaxID=97972 RepID=A0A2V1DBP5_9PLEO|nr:hypothetical protein DM02DRAFT_689964 [Periconia macrospinosa]
MVKINTTTWLGLSLATGASAACSRKLLQDTAAQYVQAQTSGNPGLLPLASNVSYIENDATVELTKGVLSQPITIDLDRSIYDTEQCIAFTEITAATNTHPYVIDTRLLVSSGKVAAIQSIVTDPGDWVFNATNHLKWAKQEKWTPIPKEKQDTRAVIKAAADAYLDSWLNGTVKVPYGTPCARIEGGIYTGERNVTANTCTMPQFPKEFTGIGDRRYVIDEELGAVDIFHNFPFIDVKRPNGTSSTNFFRIEGGMIRYIHETTVCLTNNCGR